MYDSLFYVVFTFLPVARLVVHFQKLLGSLLAVHPAADTTGKNHCYIHHTLLLPLYIFREEFHFVLKKQDTDCKQNAPDHNAVKNGMNDPASNRHVLEGKQLIAEGKARSCADSKQKQLPVENALRPSRNDFAFFLNLYAHFPDTFSRMLIFRPAGSPFSLKTGASGGFRHDLRRSAPPARRFQIL